MVIALQASLAYAAHGRCTETANAGLVHDQSASDALMEAPARATAVRAVGDDDTTQSQSGTADLKPSRR
jgi:hypothetical protein